MLSFAQLSRRVSLLYSAIDRGSLNEATRLVDELGINRPDNIIGNTLLHVAVQQSYQGVVEFLVGKGANINIQNKIGDTPLHEAVKDPPSHIEVVKFLINEGADLDITNRRGRTPLHESLYAENFVIARHIINGNTGINVQHRNLNFINKLDGDKKAALHIIAQQDNSWCLQEMTMKRLVSLLVRKGALIDVMDNNGNTPLHIAASQGNDKAVKCFIDDGADVGIINRNGNTALHFAVLKDYIEIVRDLLDKNPSIVDQENMFNQTALHMASENDYLDVAKVLVEKGANLNIENDEGKKPLDLAYSQEMKDLLEKRQQQLCDKLFDVLSERRKRNQGLSKNTLDTLSEEDIKEIKELINNGVSINELNSVLGITSLHAAISQGYKDITNILLSEGADVNFPSKHGDIALHVAVRGGQEYFVNLLINREANVNMKNVEGNTSLHIVALKGDVSIAKILIEKGADLNIENDEGKKPLDLASSQEMKDLLTKEKPLERSNQSTCTSTSEPLAGHSRAQQNAPSTALSQASVSSAINENNRSAQR